MRYKRAHNGGHQAIFFYKFPLMAIASILHRISGVILFLFIPFVLWVLATSLSSSAGFQHVSTYFDSFAIRFFVWVMLSALIYHLLAGIKHLLMDMGFAETLKSARAASAFVIIVSVIVMIWMGVKLL